MSVFERDRRLLEFLDGLGIHPGAGIELASRNYDGTLTLRVNGRTIQLAMRRPRRSGFKLKS